MNSISNKQDRSFTGALLFIQALFFLLAWHYQRIYMGDSSEYIYEAFNIKNYFFFYSGNPALPLTPEYMTARPPGYPLFLLLVYLFTVNNWIVLLLQNLLSVFNVLYFRKILVRLGYQKKHDWLLLLFVAMYPAQFIYSNTIAPDLLLQTCVLVYFGQYVLLMQQKNWRHGIYMSLALISGLLVKPVLYPFTLLHACILVLVALRQKVKMQRPLIIAILPLCAILVYSYWNYTRTDKFHFSSNQSFNAIYYYYFYFSDKEGIDSAGKFLKKEQDNMAAIPEYKDRYDYANERGMQLLKQNFVPYMGYHLRNSARIFIEPGKGEIDLFTGDLTLGKLYSKKQMGFYATIKQKGWGGLGHYIRANRSMPAVLLVLLFNCIKIVGLLVFFFKRNIAWHIRAFVFLLLVYFAIAAGLIANTRYFLPVSLIATGCAILGYMDLIERRKINAITSAKNGSA